MSVQKSCECNRYEFRICVDIRYSDIFGDEIFLCEIRYLLRDRLKLGAIKSQLTVICQFVKLSRQSDVECITRETKQ